MAVICPNCEGWTCARCKADREAAAGGEQGLNPLEVELVGLRAQLAEVTRQRDNLRASHDHPRVQDVVEIRELKADRDRLLAELALLRVPGGAA